MDVNGEDPEYEFSTRESMNIEDPTENNTQLKRKGTDNHTIRVNPRFSDLFSSPASGAPIIIQLVSEPCSFRLMNLTEKKSLIAGIIDIIGQVRPGTKWTQRGELYIYPTTNKQKNLLLQQKAVKQFQISCSLCKSEQEVRGVIYNVPPNNTEEELLSLLANQGVKTVKRFTKRGPNNTTTISTMVTLHFDATTLPREVIIAHEVFLVKKFIQRPYLCRKCWLFGHPEEPCPVVQVCRTCACAHEEDQQCTSPPKCPTCEGNDHEAGTAACPIFARRQEIIKFAYVNNMSVTEAGKIHSSSPKPTAQQQVPRHHTNEDTTTRREIDDLKAQIEELRQAATRQDTPSDISTRLEKVELEITTIKTQLGPIMELEAQMAIGFSSLDNRLTMMCAMFEQDRLDRLARQKEKDRRKTADLSPYTKTRNQGSGTQPTQPQRRSETEAPKKTTKQ
jgi:hypothetical protein